MFIYSVVIGSAYQQILWINLRIRNRQLLRLAQTYNISIDYYLRSSE